MYDQASKSRRMGAKKAGSLANAPLFFFVSLNNPPDRTQQN